MRIMSQQLHLCSHCPKKSSSVYGSHRNSSYACADSVYQASPRVEGQGTRLPVPCGCLCIANYSHVTTFQAETKTWRVWPDRIFPQSGSRDYSSRIALPIVARKTICACCGSTAPVNNTLYGLFLDVTH